MTEELQQAIEDAPETVADNESTEPTTEESQVEVEAPETDSNEDGEVEFPKKAVNALNRKDKKINKLRAQMRELEAQLNKSPEETGKDPVNEDDYETYGDFMNAKVEALVEQRLQQSQSDMQTQQLKQQQEALQAQRDQYIVEQAKEVSETLTDLPQVWEQNAQLLDSLPKEVADIFYNIDNAPAAIYTLAKEGKLESLMYTNPSVAAYEIVNAQNRGMELLSKPQTKVSQAPAPIEKARGTGSVKKQLSPDSDVLKSLGLKQ